MHIISSFDLDEQDAFSIRRRSGKGHEWIFDIWISGPVWCDSAEDAAVFNPEDLVSFGEFKDTIWGDYFSGKEDDEKTWQFVSRCWGEVNMVYSVDRSPRETHIYLSQSK